MNAIDVARAILAYEDAKERWEKARRFTVGRQVIAVDGRAVLIQSVNGLVNAEILPLVSEEPQPKIETEYIPPRARNARQRKVRLPASIGKKLREVGAPIGDLASTLIALGAERFEEGAELPEDPGVGPFSVTPYIKTDLLDEAKRIADERDLKIISVLRGWLLLGLDE